LLAGHHGGGGTMGYKPCAQCGYQWNPRKRFTCMQCGRALVTPGAMVPKPKSQDPAKWPWHDDKKDGEQAGWPSAEKGKGKGKGKGKRWSKGKGYGKSGSDTANARMPDPVAMCETLRLAMEKMPGMDNEKLKQLDGVMETAKNCKQSMEEMRKPDVDPTTAEARKHFEEMRKCGFFKDDPQLLESMRTKLGLDVQEAAHVDKTKPIANVVWNLEQKLARKNKASTTADAALVECEHASEAARVALDAARDLAIERKLALGEVQQQLAEARESAVQQNLLSAVAAALPMVPGSVVTGGLPGMSPDFLGLPETQKDLGNLQRLVKSMYDKQAAENSARKVEAPADLPNVDDEDDWLLGDIGDDEFGKLDDLEPAAKRKRIAELVRNSQQYKRDREVSVGSGPNADASMGMPEQPPARAQQASPASPAKVPSPAVPVAKSAPGDPSAKWAAEAAKQGLDAVQAGKITQPS
jgi:hypothetical protein